MKEFVKYAFLMSILFPVFSCERTDMPEKPEISISIDVPEIGQTFASAVFEAEQDTATFYCGIIHESMYVDDETIKMNDMLLLEDFAEREGISVAEAIRKNVAVGRAEKDYSDLCPGLSYYVYAYELNTDGIATGPVYKEKFDTQFHNSINVGDFFMADGTIVPKDETLSQEMMEDVVGIVFWTGDPGSGENDATMRKEKPFCRNGLAVALDTMLGIWGNSSQKLVDSWVVQDGRYQSILWGYEENVNQPYNRIRGYNNTMAIDAYNSVASPQDNVVSVERVMEYAEDNPLPFNTSGWYMPSAKEANMMIIGDFDEDIWSISAPEAPEPEVKNAVNESLAKVSGVLFDEFPTSMWTSTEHSPYYAFIVLSNSVTGGAVKVNDVAIIRPVFAF